MVETVRLWESGTAPVRDGRYGARAKGRLLSGGQGKNPGLEHAAGEALPGLSGGFWKLASGGYSYTEYEFNDLDTGAVSEAFICIKDQENNGGKYFDIVDIPAESLQELSYIEREYQFEAFLWNDSEKITIWLQKGKNQILRLQ